jgi:hypothetical protein
MEIIEDVVKLREKIKKEEFWKFYEIKACLVRYDDKDKWKIAFLRVHYTTDIINPDIWCCAVSIRTFIRLSDLVTQGNS